MLVPPPPRDYPYQKKIEDSSSPADGKRHGSASPFLAHLTPALYFLLLLIYGSYASENFLFLPRCTRSARCGPAASLRLEEGRRKGAPATQPDACRTVPDLHHLRLLVAVPRKAVFAGPSALRGGSSTRCSGPAVS